MTQYLFYFLSFLSVLSALMVVFSKNAVHSVLYLIITFFSIAGHYILLNAQFLAVVHVIVYAGAIMVLFLYVIMLLNLNKDTEPQTSNISRFAAVIAGGIFLLVLTAGIRSADTLILEGPRRADTGLIENLGQVLFKQYLLPFEVSSLLFLAAMVGAVMLGKNELK